MAEIATLTWVSKRDFWIDWENRINRINRIYCRIDWWLGPAHELVEAEGCKLAFVRGVDSTLIANKSS